jgi:HlyD family secretion protein
MTAMNKRIVIWTVLAGLVASALMLAFRPQPVAVDLTTVQPGTMVVMVAEEGFTRVHDMYELSAPVAGRVKRIEVHVGDAVVAGETVLAQIEPGDPTLLDPRSEAQARAALQTAESALVLAQAEVKQAEAEMEFAESEWRRSNDLVAKGTISRRDFDNADRGHKAGKAALDTARAALQMRMFELDQARAQLLSPAEARAPHEDCDCVPITAPVSGRVMRILNPSARVVASGEPLLEIGNPGDLEIIVDFLSADAVLIRPGQTVIIEGWGGPEPLAGRVRVVEPFGFTKVSALGIEEQRVNVTIDFVGPAEQRERLGHGYQVEARVVLWEAESVLTVPLTALFRTDEGWAVFVEEDGRSRARPVQLSQRNGLVAEVVEGLQPGDRVLTHLSDRITGGARITERDRG